MTKTNSNSKGRHKPRHSNGSVHKHNNSPISKNTVFDSNGPCGKIRGNISQIIEKYQAAAKDAMTHNEYVLAELCMQYSDHYNRISASIVVEQPKKQYKQEKSVGDDVIENKPIKENNRRKTNKKENIVNDLDLSIPTFSTNKDNEETLVVENA